jgi:hypothetical protein
MRITTVALALLLTACASTDGPIGVTGVADRIFCGLERDGVVIPETEIAAFVADVVEPRFPEGFTMWRAEGHWSAGGAGDDGREPTLVIEIVHPYGASYERKVREIAEEYKRRFDQQSVMRVTTPAILEFTSR